jgi:Flp pilus assembly protein TadG
MSSRPRITSFCSRPTAGIRRLSRTRGSVTAEFAVLLPGMALLLAAVLAAGSAATAQLRCIDAARSAARLAARHESQSSVLAAGRSAAPAGALIQVSEAGDQVRAQVRAEISLPLPGRPALGMSAVSVAQLEQ